MPTRFDHAVIGVRDLDAAVERFQQLGFEAVPGGRHAGRGTHNALIRFGLDYVELLAVHDEPLARAHSKGGPIIADYLHGHEAALVGYALATNDIERDARRFCGTSSTYPQPVVMERTRPDGNHLSWRTLSPDGNAWKQPWPFLIQWDTPDEQRLQIDQPGTHPNGALAWTRIAIATPDLESTLAIYQDQLGLTVSERVDERAWRASRATVSVGTSSIDLFAPAGEGPIQQLLVDHGVGPFLLTFAVQDLAGTRTYLTQRDIQFVDADGIEIVPAEAFGVDIQFIQA